MTGVTLTGNKEIEEKLKNLSWKKGRNLLRRITTQVVSNCRERINNQVDLEGKPFKSRSLNADEKLKNKKLLLALRDWMRVVYSGDKQAIIGFSGKQLQIATEQQQGKVEKGTAAKNRTYAGSKKPATLKQAKELLRLGFKVKINGKTRKPTVSYIKTNYTIAEAGVAIRRIRGWRGEKIKEEWDIILPPRSFFGITEDEYKEFLQMVNEEIGKSLNS